MSSLPEGTLIAFIDKTNNKVVAAYVVEFGKPINVKLPKGSYRVVAAKRGYEVYEDEVEITADTTLNITLTVPFIPTPIQLKVNEPQEAKLAGVHLASIQLKVNEAQEAKLVSKQQAVETVEISIT